MDTFTFVDKYALNEYALSISRNSIGPLMMPRSNFERVLHDVTRPFSWTNKHLSLGLLMYGIINLYQILVKKFENKVT